MPPVVVAATKRPGRPPKPKRVVVFVDYENVRKRLKANFQEEVGPRRLAKAVRDIAGGVGEFRRGTFYGDWSLRPDDAREIEEEQFKAENVLRTRGGKDRADAAMLVELGELASSKEFDLFLLISGDSDFAVAIRKLREKGKHVTVAAVSLDAARELLTVADDFIALEQRLGLQVAPPEATGTPEWDSLILRLVNVEETLPYVVRNYFRDRILGGPILVTEALLRRAETEKIVMVEEIDNPKLPNKKVKVITLNRSHPSVAEALLQR